MMDMTYETVIGLEIHAELSCRTKIFCGCSTEFGAPANTHTCPVCMGWPGALPVLNRRAVELAVKAGLALGCSVPEWSVMERKNYFYPDLPKGYQISQLSSPICGSGVFCYPLGEGTGRLRINRIQLEEDAGKLMHRPDGTGIDFNRCGVPLIEIVTEPDLRSAEEVRAALTELRRVLLFAGVCDGKMQEGSLRCDVNLSVRPAGSEAFGVRTEMKNLNSFQFAVQAVEYESSRQIALCREGKPVARETRRFDESTGTTVPLRAKEEAADYRFFPEPDLPRVHVPPEMVEALARELPALPAARREQYALWGLTREDGEALLASPDLADYFDTAAGRCAAPKPLCNLILGELRGEPYAADPAALARVAELWAEGTVNSTTAKKLASRLLKEGFDPDRVIAAEGLSVLRDPETLRAGVEAVLSAAQGPVAQYLAGKTAVEKALFGQCMGRFGGRADPAALAETLHAALEQISQRKQDQ